MSSLYQLSSLPIQPEILIQVETLLKLPIVREY